MLESYFFIPANSERFIGKSQELKADHFILDLEDSVPFESKKAAIRNIEKWSYPASFYVRPDFYPNGKFDLWIIDTVYKLGIRKFILPKLFSIDDIDRIVKVYSGCRFILLVEHPGLLMDLDRVLRTYGSVVDAVAFGSQDYAMYSGLHQSQYHMNFARFYINMIATVHDKKMIDTASMGIEDVGSFEKECINAFKFGFTGKFLIHPRQLEILKKVQYFTNAEIEWAKKAIRTLEDDSIGRGAVYNIDGLILEKPHFLRLNQIKKYLEER